MATHSSIFAWRISWTEELGGLPFIVHKESDTIESTGSDSKESARSMGDPGMRRFPWRRVWQPCILQYSCLENPMDRRGWWTTVHRVTKSQTQLSSYTYFLSTVYRAHIRLERGVRIISELTNFFYEESNRTYFHSVVYLTLLFYCKSSQR